MVDLNINIEKLILLINEWGEILYREKDKIIRILKFNIGKIGFKYVGFIKE